MLVMQYQAELFGNHKKDINFVLDTLEEIHHMQHYFQVLSFENVLKFYLNLHTQM